MPTGKNPKIPAVVELLKSAEPAKPQGSIQQSQMTHKMTPPKAPNFNDGLSNMKWEMDKKSI